MASSSAACCSLYPRITVAFSLYFSILSPSPLVAVSADAVAVVCGSLSSVVTVSRLSCLVLSVSAAVALSWGLLSLCADVVRVFLPLMS